MPFNTLLSYQTDLARGVTRTPIRPALLTQDSQAHTIRVACMRAGSAESLNGAAVRGYFVRADGVTVPLDGSVDGNAACVTLTQACYAVPGRFQLVMKASLGNTVATMFFGDGAVAVSQTDAFLDNDRIIPSLEELLQQISAMEDATAAANQVANLQVTATTLSPGAQATAAYAGGVLSLGIPRGDVGQVGAPGGGAPYNILDNSWFVNPVNQRDQTVYTGEGYTIDRWVLINSGDGTLTVDNANGCITLYRSTALAYLNQRIDPQVEKTIIGKTVTFAVMAKGHGHLAIRTGYKGKESQVSNISSDDYAIGFTTIQVTEQNTWFQIASRLGSKLSIKWAALYEGSYTAETLPPYTPKGYAAELAECRRYYQTIPALTHIPGVTNTSVSFGAKYKIPTMRIAPTVSIASGQEVSIYTGEYSASTTNYTMQYATMPNQMILNLSLGAGSFVAYKPGMLTFPVEIALSANL